MTTSELIPAYYKDFYAKPTETLFEHTENLLFCLEQLKDYLPTDIYHIVLQCCLYHDIGKLNPHFQKRVCATPKVKMDTNKEIGHNILSYCIAKDRLKDVLDKQELRVALYAILNHHHYVNNLSSLENQKQLIIDNLQQFSLENYDAQSFSIGMRECKTLRKLSESSDPTPILVKGFLHKCDYSASAHLPVEIKNQDLLTRLEGLGYKWREMQTFAKNNSNKNLMIIGSTGLGKTEASLLWQGNNKGFYVLPLRTAINAMFKRIKEQLYIDDFSQYLGLLHSETRNVYLEIEQGGENEVAEDYYEKTKNLTLPLTICTPDQLFRFVFKYPGYELFLATLSYSKIIIDEIQAYSPDLLASIIYGLQMIVRFGGKFAITTATFPPFIKHLLAEDCAVEWEEAVFLNDQVRHRVQLIEDEICVEDIADFYYQEETDSRKILVVVNTVKKAQAVYQALKAQISAEDCQISLLHSKFTVGDRAKKEQQIIDDGETSCKKHVIWVTTQVVEASLDIDFDYLFTEYSDLSSLFQRMGRCNRKGLKRGQDTNVFVYLDIEERLISKISVTAVGKRKGFIYKSLYELGKAALVSWGDKHSTNEMSEKDKLQMIDEYYTYEKMIKFEKELPSEVAKYLDDYHKKRQYLKELEPWELNVEEAYSQFRNILSIKAIPYNLYYEHLEEIESCQNKIKSLRDEIKNTQDNKKRKDLRHNILDIQNNINQYTLSAEEFRVEKQKTKKWDEIRICKQKYEYTSELGLSVVETKASETEPLIW